MIGALVSLAVTAAVLLLMLSLPFGDTHAGGALRRAAAFVFALAFVPPIVACLLAPLFAPGRSLLANGELLLAVVGLVALVGVASLAAYGFLDLRSRARSRQPAAHAERVRYTKHHEEADLHHEDSEAGE